MIYQNKEKYSHVDHDFCTELQLFVFSDTYGDYDVFCGKYTYILDIFHPGFNCIR